MADPKDAQYEVLQALETHFDRTGSDLRVEQISEMTGLDGPAVQNALRVLLKAHRIEGLTVEEADYPIIVTGLGYND